MKRGVFFPPPRLRALLAASPGVGWYGLEGRGLAAQATGTCGWAPKEAHWRGAAGDGGRGSTSALVPGRRGCPEPRRAGALRRRVTVSRHGFGIAFQRSAAYRDVRSFRSRPTSWSAPISWRPVNAEGESGDRRGMAGGLRVCAAPPAVRGALALASRPAWSSQPGPADGAGGSIKRPPIDPPPSREPRFVPSGGACAASKVRSDGRKKDDPAFLASHQGLPRALTAPVPEAKDESICDGGGALRSVRAFKRCFPGR